MPGKTHPDPPRLQPSLLPPSYVPLLPLSSTHGMTLTSQQLAYIYQQDDHRSCQYLLHICSPLPSPDKCLGKNRKGRFLLWFGLQITFSAGRYPTAHSKENLSPFFLARRSWAMQEVFNHNAKHNRQSWQQLCEQQHLACSQVVCQFPDTA